MEIVISITVAVILFLLVKSFYDNKNSKARTLTKLKKQWGNVPQQEYSSDKFESISDYYRKNIDKENDIDDITWNDLDMDQIFMLMNQTVSSMGEECLYSLLRKPCYNNEELTERNRVIEVLSDNNSKRYELQYILSGIGKLKTISLYEYMNRLNNVKKESNLKHYLMLVVMALSIGLIFVQSGIGIILLVCTVVYSIITYFQCKSEIEMYYSVVICIMKTLKASKAMENLDFPELTKYFTDINNSAKAMKSFNSAGFVVTAMSGNGNLMDLVMDYVRILTHIDLIKFNRMISVYQKNIVELNSLFNTLGFIDSMIAVASFRKMIDTWCLPELSISKKPFLNVTEVYHPMIENPVKNTINVSKCVLITGSNASGKSTFIKTVAINAILSQTIYTSVSDCYQASFFRIASSMALQDNLIGNESYYIVEIKSLKRILDGMNHQIPTLCFIDEVLRGTNTLERIAASSRILYSFSMNHCICFAATHDLELTMILEKQYSDYHFQEQIADGDILFDYKLKNGKAVSKNAIRLLELMGYSKEIIEEATYAAEQFELNGIWETIS